MSHGKSHPHVLSRLAISVHSWKAPVPMSSHQVKNSRRKS